MATDLQTLAPLTDTKRLFDNWGGLPRQMPYQIVYDNLIKAIKSGDAVACIQALEKGDFLSYGERDSNEIRSDLMQFEIEDDGTYEHAAVNFGSPFIREGLVEASSKKLHELLQGVHGCAWIGK